MNVAVLLGALARALPLEAEGGGIFYATHGVWNIIIQLGSIAVLMLVANLLRRCIPFVRKSLMPVSVLAGFLMLAIKLILQKCFGKDLSMPP